MDIEKIIAKITPLDKQSQALAQQRFDDFIKPIGSLAKLEEITARYCGITGVHEKNEVNYPQAALFLFCDCSHMAAVEKIIRGQSVLNVLADQSDSKIFPLPVTVSTEAEALAEGAALAQQLIRENKLGVIALGCLADTSNLLTRNAMAGAILLAAAMKVPIVLDGVATLRAAQTATLMAPTVLEYCLAGQVTAEAEAENVLNELGFTAPLRLHIKASFGVGSLLALTLLYAGIKVYKEMETFAEAGVHVEMKEFSMAEQKKNNTK